MEARTGIKITRRTKFEIIADILRLGKASKTKIMYSSNLSFRLLEKYLAQLCDQGFLIINQEDGKTVYSATEEGRELMGQIDEIVKRLA